MTNEWSFVLAVATAIVTAAAGIVLTLINQRGQQRIEHEQRDIKEAARRSDQYISEERMNRQQEISAATLLRHELRNDNQVLRIEITNLRTEFDECRQKFIDAEHKIWVMEQELNTLRRQCGFTENPILPEPPGK